MRTTIGIAIDIPEPWGSQLTCRRAEAGDPQAAYVPAHVTLLGPTPVATDRLDEIDRHLGAVATRFPPFTLHLRGTGTFRPVTDVVFVTVAAGISECELLAAAVAECPAIVRELRFPYHPHVTVAQDVAPEAMDAVFADLAGFEARFTVGGYRLFEHGPDGKWHSRSDHLLGGTGALPPA